MNEHLWEDNLFERKVESDLKDLLKTLVAFSNTVKPGHKAVILIGERDDGTVVGVTNPDNIQKKVREECDKIFPDILYRMLVYEKESKNCVRIEIEYSGDTPHFGGQAWVRKGSETIKATDEIFQKLIDIRTDSIRELFKWVNKEVTIYGDLSTVPEPRKGTYFGTCVFTHHWPGFETYATLLSVNKYWATFRTDKNERISEPLQKLILSYDNKRDQLKIIVAY